MTGTVEADDYEMHGTLSPRNARKLGKKLIQVAAEEIGCDGTVVRTATKAGESVMGLLRDRQKKALNTCPCGEKLISWDEPSRRW